jgi:hypothetical protein
MTEKEADQIIDFLYGMFRPPDLEGTRKHWRMQLASLDADLASKSAIQGMQSWRFFPPWADFKEIYRSLDRLARPAPVEETKRGVAAPEWVHVWAWCRGWGPEPRAESIERPFPQQDGYVDMTDSLTMDEYEDLHKEWVSAGSPKAKIPLPTSLGS